MDTLNDEPDSCSSGYLLRLMNVLEGYTHFISVDPRLELKDSFKHKLNKMINDSPHMDEIMEGIVDKKEEYIIRYLYPFISEIRDKLIIDYKDILSIEVIEEEIRKNTIAYTI
jgi:hypothetical protein